MTSVEALAGSGKAVLHPEILPAYVALDLETTGGSGGSDRITELAAVRVEQGCEVARFSTLLNPGVPIPPFIERLTGIGNAMVEHAPSFKSVADQVLSLLDGAVLVAHNAPFDHGFLCAEFDRLGQALKVSTLCSVRLSRALYPAHRSHGLDALIARHGLKIAARHRAMGDVDLVLQWLSVASAEQGVAAVARKAKALVRGPESASRLRAPGADRRVPLRAVHAWPFEVPVWFRPAEPSAGDEPDPWELVFQWQLLGMADDTEAKTALDRATALAFQEERQGKPMPQRSPESDISLADYRRWADLLKKQTWRWRLWQESGEGDPAIGDPAIGDP